MTNKFPDHIMHYLRGREGIDNDDTSKDEMINQMSPAEAFREVVTWHLGHRGWANTIAKWMRGCGAKPDDFIAGD